MSESQFLRYAPKRWKPEFSLIVMDSISGMENDEIAEKYGYTKQHISNILCTSQAAEMRRNVQTKINEHFEGSLKERLAVVQEQAVRHIEDFISARNGFENVKKDPFGFIDRVIKVAGSGGSLGDKSGSNNVSVTNTVNNLQVNHFENLGEALDRSMKVEELGFVDRSKEVKLLPINEEVIPSSIKKEMESIGRLKVG